MNTYERKTYGPYTIEVVTYPNGMKQLIAHPKELSKSNGGYDYYTDLTTELTKSFIKECNKLGLIVRKKYIRLKESGSFDSNMIDIAIDAMKNRLPITCDIK